MVLSKCRLECKNGPDRHLPDKKKLAEKKVICLYNLSRAAQSLSFVKRNVETRSRDIKTKVYKALVRPRLE